jgi:hypothetical protein
MHEVEVDTRIHKLVGMGKILGACSSLELIF